MADDDDCSNGGGYVGFRGGDITLTNTPRNETTPTEGGGGGSTTVGVPVLPLWLLAMLGIIMALIGIKRLDR